jgi:hypothetical protein
MALLRGWSLVTVRSLRPGPTHPARTSQPRKEKTTRAGTLVLATGRSVGSAQLGAGRRGCHCRRKYTTCSAADNGRRDGVPICAQHGSTATTPHSRDMYARLGHATLAETMDTYAHLFADTKGLGRTAVDQILRPVLTEPERNCSALDYKPAGQRRRRASRPVGRVLCTRLRGPTAIHLGLPLPAASCGLPASIGRAALNRSRRSAPLPAPPS